MRYMTEDVLFEIFVRLPINSICKFKCVSKSCVSLFSSPSFIKLNFDNSVMKSCGGSSTPWAVITRHHFKDQRHNIFKAAIHKRSFFSTSSTELHHQFISTQLQEKFTSSGDGFSFELVKDSKNMLKQEQRCIFPLASSNGLVLCSSTEATPRDFYIWNPYTNQFLSLPLPRPNRVGWSSDGLGFVSDSGTYKVIRVECCGSSRNFNLQIFSSDTNEWSTRQIACSKSKETGSSNRYQDIYIVNHSRIWYWIDRAGDRMIAYDDNHNHNSDSGVGGECRLIDLPEGRTSEQQLLGESKGLLCYACIGVARPISTICVWVFQDGYYNNGSTWQLVCKDTEILCGIPYYPRYYLVAFSPVDPNVVIMGGPYVNHELAYNIQTRKSQVLRSSHPDVSLDYFRGYLRAPTVVTLQPTIIPTTAN